MKKSSRLSRKKPPNGDRVKIQSGGKGACADVEPSSRLSDQVNANGDEIRAGCPIVGIGVAAGGGGLEAIVELLSHLPPESGMVYVVVQHGAPDHDVITPQILSRHTRMPVLEAEHDLRLEPDHVYVIQPNVSMRITGGLFKRGPREGEGADGKLRAIDLLFESLCREAGTLPVGVVLAGTDCDGADGLAQIKAAGGMMFVQDERSAKVDRMPRNAIAAGVVDKVLAPAEIGRELGRLAATLVQQAGAVKGVPGLKANGTAFFRDPEAFDVLKEQVFPGLVGNRTPDDLVRLWVAGCSSGQEVYSLAMAYLEFSASTGTPIPLQIFGTDINETMLDRARAGRFPRSEVQELSPERLRRFFVEEAGGFRVGKPLREMCIFARHDVVNDPPFLRMDMVSCRNLLIYFEPVVQKKLIPVFHRALKPGGVLLLGNDESVGEYADLFALKHKSRRIYVKKPDRLTATTNEPPAAGLPEADAQREADRIMLAKYAPAGVIVNANLEIIQFRGSTSRYLEPAPDAAKFHLLKMARAGLPLPLRTALQRAKRDREPVRKEGVVVQVGGRPEKVNFEVWPLKNLRKPCFLVFFEPSRREDASESRLALKEALETVPEPLLVLTDDLRVESANRSYYTAFGATAGDTLGRFIYDLNEGRWNIPRLRRRLQEIIPKGAALDEFEVDYESARTGHRTLVLNARCIDDTDHKPGRLLLAIDDITERLGVELLRESERRYRTLAESLPQLVWTCAPDGPLDYTNERWTEFTGLPREKLLGDQWRETMHPVDREETYERWIEALKGAVPYDLEYRLRRHDGQYRWFKVRAVPLRTQSGEIVRWFGTSTDIEDRKQAEHLLSESERWFRLLIQSVKDFAIFTMDVGGVINSWNPGAEAMFGYKTEEVVGQPVAILFTDEDQASGVPAKDLIGAQRDGASVDERWHKRRDGTRLFMSGTTRVIGDETGALHGFIKVARDITDTRRQQAELKEARDSLGLVVAERTAQLQDTVQQLEAFSYTVSHDLRAPLRAMLGFAEALQEDCGDQLSQEGRGYAARIIAAAHRLDRLINDILLYSRTARANVQLQPVDLEQIVADALQEQPAFQPPQAEIEVVHPLPSVMGHEPSVMQCVANLLSNAVKFVPKGCTPRIRIYTEIHGEAVRLIIEDNGVGIAPEDIGRIFRLFERLHPASAFEGTGIGLTIVRKAVERMGGEVGVSSELGKGSRFWIQLPRAP